ncbi:sodium-translocating pyrophosphatase [Candidatus Aerophobetes bacterium]|uniref:Putative K(+)-stimulated pyrophosphate-energized sodium pump n=1 Tax=Aerophobetes bacterium TaxID=2030807 RepID=A0A523Y0T5_UNCAE|nr:MAG: sodium-translocating pyrophosphatase [Candidatus Aerophobetes bacterium]
MWQVFIPAGAGVIGLIGVGFLIKGILKASSGNKLMTDISRTIQQGAKAFLFREYRTVAILVVIVVALLSLAPFFVHNAGVNWQTALAFVIGVVCSASAGWIGMSIATRANSRTTEAARRGLKPALNISFSAGAVTGLSVVCVAFLGLVVVYLLFKGKPAIINGYAMGASLMALFARAGGGIYTKGADMGADLVGKVEAGIPEDDPRNPAVIADNVGDNVGDVAGLGADLLESYVESIIATLAIAASIAVISLTYLPFYLAGWGILCSLIGVGWIKMAKLKDPQATLNGGTYISAALMMIGSFFIIKYLGAAYGDYSLLGPFWAIIAGILSGLVIGEVSVYYSSSKYKPVKELANSCKTGPAIAIVNGLSLGMLSTLVPVLVIAAATLIGFSFAGMYGVAMAALGMLSILGVTLAVDSYGPVADNAGGIAEMAQLPGEVRQVTDKLDAVGNTTAAIGKGFAIGSAAFAALGLITAYRVTINSLASGSFTLSLADPKLIAGLLIGGMVPYLYGSLLARGVGRVAFQVVEEVRRQFREIPGLMKGKAKADSTKCVDIAARGALKNMMLPGILAIIIPVGIGFVLGPVALGGFLVGSLVVGLPLGIQTANTGAALDNAKKYIEEGNLGGKGSPAHKASVVGDTVGDPLKDTVGPSINILIKLMSVISLVLAPLFVALH